MDWIVNLKICVYPGTYNMPLLGKRIFADVIKVTILRQAYLGLSLDPMDYNPAGFSFHGDSSGKKTGVWRVNAAIIGKVEMRPQAGLSVWAERASKWGVC